MSGKEHQANTLLKSFSQRPIAYHRVYAEITGSVKAGILLSQIVYWWYAVDEREFWKTDHEFCEELAMGPRELKTAKARLKELKIISATRKGIPAKTYYRLEETELLTQIASWAKTHQLDRAERTNYKNQNVPSITKTNLTDYSENNKETTKLSPKEILDLDLEINEARKKFVAAIEKIFHISSKEAVTFARITKHLVNICQTGEAELSIFDNAINWAKEAKRCGKRPKALFVSKIKRETGFSKQKLLLR